VDLLTEVPSLGVGLGTSVSKSTYQSAFSNMSTLDYCGLMIQAE